MYDIAENSLSGCYKNEAGVYFATAGQRVVPSRQSSFVWRETSTYMQRQKLSLMSYTNWHPNTPNYGFSNEACMNLWSGRNYTWNDYACSAKICSVCEIDMTDH